MSYVLSVNGVNHTLPSQSERNWSSQVNAFFEALSTTTLQKIGGSFTLGAEVDFGYAYGSLLAYIKSRPQDPNTYPVASTGFLRLHKADEINWKNQAGTAEVKLGLSTSDRLQCAALQAFSAVASTDVFTAAITPNAGDVIQFVSFTGTGITLSNLYYVFNVTNDTFQCYTTPAGPAVLDVLTDGTGMLLVRDDLVTRSSVDILRNKKFRDLALDHEAATITSGVLTSLTGKAFQRITSSTPTAVLNEIDAPTAGKTYYLLNVTGSDITIEHNTGTATKAIYTPGSSKFAWKNNTVLPLIYDSVLAAWVFTAADSSGLNVTVKSANFTADLSTHNLCNTSSGAITATLPTGSSGSIVRFSDANSSWSVNNLTVTPATGQAIGMLAINTSIVVSTNNGFLQLVHDGTKWVVDSNAVYQEASSVLPGTVNLKKIAVPHTSIIGRALCTDFSKDGLPRLGIDRFLTQAIISCSAEYGTNDRQVFRPMNDLHEACRFVGKWTMECVSYEALVRSNLDGDYLEITFYGTGLNLLVYYNQAFDVTVYVDGSGSGTTVTYNNISDLADRYIASNWVINVVGNLSLGLHTVKIAVNTTKIIKMYGYEVVTDGTSIRIPETTSYMGGGKLLAAATSIAYDSTFESGSLGSKGGHVLIYQKSDGTIAKAVTATDVTAQFMDGTPTHENEEVIRNIHYREFGANRTDDFNAIAYNTSNLVRYGMLDDNTTSLGSNGIAGTYEGVTFSTNSAYVILTFMGTGLDIVRYEASATVCDTHSLYVDGVSKGTFNTTSSVYPRLVKICSGLPYGSHTVKITRDATGNNSFYISNFVIYGPKTPTLPSGSVAIADYFVMADYVATSTVDALSIGSGLMRKHSARELTVQNGTGGTTSFSYAYSGNFAGLCRIRSDRLNAYVEYPFFGTGFEARFASASNGQSAVLVSITHVATGGVASFGSLTVSTWGTGVSFDTGTGLLDQQDAAAQQGCGLSISGLTLGYYIVKFNNTAASSYLEINTIDIISKIHVYKDPGPGRINCPQILGSCGVRDLRKFSPLQHVEQKAHCYSMVQANVTFNCNSGSDTPFLGLNGSIKTSGGPLSVSYNATILWTNATNAPALARFRVYVNGIPYGNYSHVFATASNQVVSASDTVIVPVPAGTYKVEVYLHLSPSTNNVQSYYLAGISSRGLSITEL